MRTNGTENANEWDREHERMGQKMRMNGTEHMNERTINVNRKQNTTMNERGSE